MRRAVLVAWLGGCRPPPVAPNEGDWPLWVALDLTEALDLGHVPTPVAVAPPAPLAFVDGTDAAGLGAAVSGGNQHGVAVALVDVDGDERPDLLLANGTSNASGVTTPSSFWRNRGDGTFERDPAALGGALDDIDAYAVAGGDVDADGDLDLYVAAQPTNVLLRNRGDGTFEDATVEAGAGATPSNPALVADGRGKLVVVDDFDGDGWLDLVSATSTQRDPGATLLHNRGDGTFEDWTERSGVRIASDGHPCAMMFTDVDNDGLRDLWIWNDRGGHVLLHHDGERFENLGNRADQVFIRNPMGIDAADIDLDGDLEYYVSNIGAHPMLDNRGAGTFLDVSLATRTTGDFGWGLGFRDFDLDGFPDLLVFQEDARPPLAYHNGGNRRFSRVELPGLRLRSAVDAHAVPAAFGDVDGDGRVDAIAARTDGSPVTLLRNVTPLGGRHGLEVVIRAAPDPGGRGGVGARVAVGTGERVLFQDLTGGASRASQSELSARFGLDDRTGAEWVVVLWPDGRQRAFTNVPAGRLVVE